MDTAGSKRAMSVLMQGLLKTMDELEQVCNEISYMSDEIDELNFLDDIRMNVEVAVAMSTEHLDARDTVINQRRLERAHGWLNYVD